MIRTNRKIGLVRKVAAASGLTAAFLFAGSPVYATADTPDTSSRDTIVDEAADGETVADVVSADDAESVEAEAPSESDTVTTETEPPPTDKPAPVIEAANSSSQVTPTAVVIDAEEVVAPELTAVPTTPPEAPVESSDAVQETTNTTAALQTSSPSPALTTTGATGDTSNAAPPSTIEPHATAQPRQLEAPVPSPTAAQGVGSYAVQESESPQLAAATEAPLAQSFTEVLASIPGTIVANLLDALTNALEPLIGPGAPFDYPAGWAFLVVATRNFKQSYANGTPIMNPRQTSQDLDDNEIHGTFGGADPDGDSIQYVVTAQGDTAPVNGTVAVDQATGTWTYTPRAGFVGSDVFTVTANDGSAGSHIHAFGTGHSVTAVVNVTVAPTQTNSAPVVTVASQAQSGGDQSVTFTVTTSDADGDDVIVGVGNPEHGTITRDPSGAFVYVPDPAYAHSLSQAGSASTGTDAVTFTATDSRGASTAAVATVSIAPSNSVPVLSSVVVGTPAPETNAVIGAVLVTDADGDAVDFFVTAGPTSGVVQVGADGTFTYTPSSEALLGASSGGATSDRFTISVGDGHGGSVAVSVDNVPIGFAPGTNSAPVAAPNVSSPDAVTGVVTGSLGATDRDGDPLTYDIVNRSDSTAVLTVDQQGNFTYTPTVESRYSAAASFGPDPDSFTVAISDGRGGTTTVTVAVPIAPLADAENAAPVLVSFTTTPSDPFTGVVRGRITASDADGDTLRFRGSRSGPLGNLTLGSDGSFTYAPSAAAREFAASSPNYQYAMFTVSVDDQNGGVLTVPVVVGIRPADPRVTVVDPTSVPTAPSPGGPDIPGADPIVVIRYLDLIGIPGVTNVAPQSLFDVYMVSSRLRSNRDVFIRPCGVVIDPCIDDPFDKTTERWTRNGVVPKFLNPETGLYEEGDVYLVSTWNEAGTYSNGIVTGYRKMTGTTLVEDDYPNDNGFRSYGVVVVRAGTFPDELFGPDADDESGTLPITINAEDPEKTDLDLQIEDEEFFRDQYADLAERLSVFDPAVTWAFNAAAYLPGASVPVKSVIVAGNIIQSGALQNYSDIPVLAAGELPELILDGKLKPARPNPS